MSSTRSANTMKANASTYQEDQPTDIRPLMDKKSLRWIVVGGPPGHGKTTISVALVYDLARRGDRVLLVSMHALKPGTEAHAAVKAMYLPDDNEVNPRAKPSMEVDDIVRPNSVSLSRPLDLMVANDSPAENTDTRPTRRKTERQDGHSFGETPQQVDEVPGLFVMNLKSLRVETEFHLKKGYAQAVGSNKDLVLAHVLAQTRWLDVIYALLTTVKAVKDAEAKGNPYDIVVLDLGLVPKEMISTIRNPSKPPLLEDLLQAKFGYVDPQFMCRLIPLRLAPDSHLQHATKIFSSHETCTYVSVITPDLPGQYWLRNELTPQMEQADIAWFDHKFVVCNMVAREVPWGMRKYDKRKKEKAKHVGLIMDMGLCLPHLWFVQVPKFVDMYGYELVEHVGMELLDHESTELRSEPVKPVEDEPEE